MGIVHTAKKMLALVASLALVSLLAGCYTTEHPLYENGDRVALTGSLICITKSGDGKNEEVNTYVVGETRFSPDNGKSRFAYTAVANESGTVSKLVFIETAKDGMYLVQESLNDGTASYMWFDEPRHIFYTETKATDFAKELARANKVTLDDSGNYIRVTGTDANMRAFLLGLGTTVSETPVRCLPN